MGTSGVTAYVLKCLDVPQRSLLVLMSDLWILNHCLRLIAEPIYSCVQLLHSTKYITLQKLQYNSSLTKYFLKYNLVFKKHIIVADITTWTEKTSKKREEINAVSKKELKRLKKTHLTKTLSIFHEEIKISFSKRTYICTYTNKC